MELSVAPSHPGTLGGHGHFHSGSLTALQRGGILLSILCFLTFFSPPSPPPRGPYWASLLGLLGFIFLSHHQPMPSGET